MAWNIGQIRKYFIQTNPKLLLKEAEKLEFKGKNNEAIDKYLDFIFEMKKDSANEDEQKAEIQKAVIKIENLGGSVPK